MSHELPEQPVLHAAQTEQAARLLGRAFQDDPLMVYLVPQATRRTSVLPSFFRVVLRYCLRYGVVYSTQTLDAVACCLPPHQTSPSTWRLLRVAMSGAAWLPGPFELRRSLRAAVCAEETHTSVAPVPHWYLWTLGVEPEHHGRGIGSQLLQRVILQACAQGVPCYLETENPRNVPLYQRHGFRLLREVLIPTSTVHIYALLRDPGQNDLAANRVLS